MDAPYTPMPVDTSKVLLSDEIVSLVEQLAQNVHEMWALRRISEGWKYGPYRDDKTKEHPSLVPYEALPESEKHYDRLTAMETLKLLMMHGFKIDKFKI